MLILKIFCGILIVHLNIQHLIIFFLAAAVLERGKLDLSKTSFSNSVLSYSGEATRDCLKSRGETLQCVYLCDYTVPLLYWSWTTKAQMENASFLWAKGFCPGKIRQRIVNQLAVQNYRHLSVWKCNWLHYVLKLWFKNLNLSLFFLVWFVFFLCSVISFWFFLY